MRNTTIFGVFLASILVANCTQYAPIPPIPDGLKAGKGQDSEGLKLSFSAFYDLMCPDSKAGYAILKPLLPQFLSNPNFLFTIHFFPLVFHREAYTMSEAVHFIQKEFGPQKAFEFIDLIFEHQEFFGTPETYNRTRSQVEKQVYALVKDNLNLNISESQYLAGVRDSNNDEASRISWKYACSKGVTGTPIYFANGVKVDGAESFDAQGFKDFFGQFLGPQNSESETESNESISSLKKKLLLKKNN